MQFVIEASVRRCYLEHVDTFEVEGTDDVSQGWLAGWSLWCRTCEALVVDNEAVVPEGEAWMREGVTGYVVSVPVALVVVEEKPRLGVKVMDRVAEAVRRFSALQREEDRSHGD